MALHNRYTVDDIHKLRTNRLALNDAILRLEPIINQAARSLGFFQESHNHEGMEVDDALQAGRIGVWKGIYRFDPDKTGRNKTLEAFLYTMARQEILDEIRRCKWLPGRRRDGPSRAIHWVDFDEFAPIEDKVLSEAETQEELETIEEAVKDMNSSHRNVYQAVMLHDEGCMRLRHGRIYANLNGITDARVSQIRAQIRNNLRKALH